MKKPTSILLLFATALSFYGSISAQVIFDESPTDASFMAFRQKLSAVIEAKDVATLRTLFADTIYESNDGCGWPGCSKDEFFQYYFLSESSEDWGIVRRILEYGFFDPGDSLYGHSIGGKAFMGPSYLRDFDDGSSLVVLGKNVNIRAAPSTKAQVLHRASFEKFPCDCNINTATEDTYQWDVDGHDWVQVKLPNGKLGYVAMEFTSESFAKRMLVVQRNGKWSIARYYHLPGC